MTADDRSGETPVFGHGEKLSRQQEAAIAALLVEPNVKAAAGKARVGEKTIRRWLQLPAFRDAYRQARARVLESAVAALQQASEQAVSTLVGLLKNRNPMVKMRAATLIIGNGFKGTDLVNVLGRLEELEQCRDMKDD